MLLTSPAAGASLGAELRGGCKGKRCGGETGNATHHRPAGLTTPWALPPSKIQQQNQFATSSSGF